MAAAQNLAGMGAMASGFITGQGGFDADGKYGAENKPYNGGRDASFAYDAQTLNTQAALVGATQFGGGGLPQGMGLMAGILPAALKIEEHKKMREVAERYYEKYIKDFNRKYGFKDDDIKALVDEFNTVTEEICRLIKDDDMRNMYRKYIDSYPTMYLSMIPMEALQTKLAVKCVTENKKLRKRVEDMSRSVSSLVRNLTDLQIEAGIPPIVNLMFESMPDPLTAMTDPMYHKYNDAIVTYHKLLQDETESSTYVRIGQSMPAPPQANGEWLRLEPVNFLKHLITQIGSDNTYTINNGATNPPVLTKKEIETLKTVMENMQFQTGCQPFGQEWNHTGPEPPMNPAMCLAEGDNFQPGNPRHNVGRTNVYQAKRDASGNAHWVQAGQVPALSAGGPQMVQHLPQQHQLHQPSPWAGQSYTPGVDPRPPQMMQQQSWMTYPPPPPPPPPLPLPLPQQQQQQQQQRQQLIPTGSRDADAAFQHQFGGSGSKPKRSSGVKSKSKSQKSSKASSKSKRA